MDKAKLRKLASLTLSGGSVNDAVRAFVLEKLSKADIKRYLFYLKEELRRSRVRVRLPGAPDAAIRAAIEPLFRGREIRYETTPALGAGLQIEYDDNILNLNMRTLIERMISGLKESV